MFLEDVHPYNKYKYLNQQKREPFNKNTKLKTIKYQYKFEIFEYLIS